MVTLNIFKSKKSKTTKETGDSESPKNKPQGSDSTIGTLESNSQSPASKEGAEAGTTKSKSKRRNSAGTLKKAREDRDADDASTKSRSRSKSKTRSKKSSADGEPVSPKKHRKKKKKDGESGYSSDSGMKSIKSKKKKSKKDKKRSSSKNRIGGGDNSRENSPFRDDSGSEEIEESNTSPRSTATKEAKSAAAMVVASFEVASPKPEASSAEAAKTESSAPKPGAPPLEKQEQPPKTEAAPKPVTPERSSVKNGASQFESSSASPKHSPGPSATSKATITAQLTVPTKANSTGSSPTRSSVQERASLFKNESATLITPGDHLKGATPATTTQSQPGAVVSPGPRRMPKGGSQIVAAQAIEEVTKQRSASVGKYSPKRSSKPVQTRTLAINKSADDIEEDDLNDDTANGSVRNKMDLFGGKVKKSMAPKQKSLDENSLNTGRLRTAFLKQEEAKKASGGGASASMVVPSFSKMATANKAPIRRSNSGGTAGTQRKQNAYLQNLQGAMTGQSLDSAMPAKQKHAMSSSIGGGAGTPAFCLAKSLGMSSSSTSTTTSKPSTTGTTSSNNNKGATSSVKSAYMNATQNAGTTTPPPKERNSAGPGKVKMGALAMFDPSLKQEPEDGSMELKAEPTSQPEKRANSVKDLIAMQGKPQAVEREGRSTTLPSKQNHRRSSSAGTIGRIRNNPARNFLEAQFAKASSTSGTIGERVNAFSAVHGSSNRPAPDEVSTPKAVRRTLNLNALNLATPGKSTSKKPMGPKRKDMKKLLSQGDGDASFADTVVSLLRDRKQKPLVRELCDRIQKADGLPKTRRLSMRDNDLIVSMIGAIQNDPDVKSIIVDGDVYFNTVSTTLLFQFVEALGMNMHLRRLTFKNVQLGNDILYALATAMEKNFILEEIDLSFNLFTNEGLANFCQSLANNNNTCKKIMLNNQTTPISVAEEENVLEAFEGNKRIMYAKVDFGSEDGQDKLNKILHRNKRNPPGAFDRDKRIIDLLSFQAERSEAIKEQKEAENKPLEVPDDDWDYLYELAVLFDKYKLKDIVEEENKDKKAKPKNADSMSKGAKSNFLFGQFKDILDDSLGCFNSDGSFLTPEFISKYLKKTQDTDELVFDFHGQWKLFKRFPVTDPARELIVTKFVDAIVTHPQMKEFMGINMANTGCGDDFLETLSERCLADPSLLPNLHVINFETNFINERGCVALSKLLSSQKSLRYLQLIRLENQKGILTSKAEFAICRAMFVNRSVVVVSLQFRGLMERQQIHKYVSRNVDYLRQARQRHYKKTGTGRKRNETEVFFDKIASNNPLVKEVKLPGDRKFLSLSAEERVKAAKAFATNTIVAEVNLNACELDDEFAEAMGKSLETNTAIVKLSLENNSISGTGIKYLLEGLAKNSTLKELRLHKQSKNVATAEEDGLADILEENQSLTKLGLDFRNQNVQVKVNRKLKMNDQLKRSKDSTDDLAGYLFA